MKIDKKKNNLISIALEHCIIGLAKSAKNIPDAGSVLNQAVTTMRRAGMIQRQPEMHLARASHLRATHNLHAAWNDHDADHAIAASGNMRTYLAECALLAGNLCLDESPIPEAATKHTNAAQLISEDGYGRRYAELHLLSARLLHSQHNPAAHQALTEAQTRICEVGQWFFWRELCAVAKEIGAPDPGKCPA